MNKTNSHKTNSTLSDILTPEDMKKMLLLHTYGEIGKMYGYTRQNVHRLFLLYQEKGLISENFLITPIGEMEHERYNIKIISFNNKTKKVLVSIDNESPRWYKIAKTTLGHYFTWGTWKKENKLKVYKLYFKDFQIYNSEKWMKFDIDYRLGQGKSEEGETQPYVVYENDEKRIQLKVISNNLFQVKMLENKKKTKMFALGKTLYHGKSFKSAINSIEKEIGNITIPKKFKKYLKISHS